ncbi:MAG: hypothetical protein N2449_09430 [Bacteroidales bacterium]|nr:hypothetical protein [Bacteroidales bacterium]
MKSIVFFFYLTLLVHILGAQTFLEKQKSNQRVAAAYKEKQTILETLLLASNLSINDLQLFIRIFKQEKLLEVWGKKKNDTLFKHITSYPLCATSGKPGPKRMQGDEQMPEGVYQIIHFNPNSSFLLSLKLNYPNASDVKFCYQNKCGNDIFIHGNCVTVGCFPIGDEAIKELYILAIEAASQGQSRIPVHIFPCKMNEQNINDLQTIYPQHQQFWNSLKPIFDYFETHRKLPLVRIKADGYYEIAR